MTEQTREHFKGRSKSFPARAARRRTQRFLPASACAVVSLLLLAPTLLPTRTRAQVSPAQSKPVQTLERVKVSSAPEEAHGPFREGVKAITPQADEPSMIDDDEDRSERRGTRSANPTATPEVREVAPGEVRRVATLAQAGRTVAEAAAKLGADTGSPTQTSARSFSFGESLFLTESQRSPAPTTLWPGGASQNTNGGLIDPQIAVSSSAVGVLTWSTLVFYDKSGVPLPSTATFANPTTIPALFAGVVTEMDKHLNLNPIVANLPAFKMAQGQVGDARIVFDVFRKRWVVVGTAKNNSSGTQSFPPLVRLSQRRTKILLAVSRDEDPSHGFNTYFFNGTPNDGACSSMSDSSPCPNSSFTPGNAGDYPSVGVSARHYLITLHVDHEPLDGSSGQPLWGYLVTVNADDVAAGSTKPRTHAFWGWGLAGGGNAEGVTMPVVKHGKLSPIDWGLIASTHDDKFVITLVSPQDPPTLGSIAFDMPDMESPTQWLQKNSFRLVNYGNVGNQPITAHMVGGKLFAAFDDCRKWVDSQNSCSPSVHLVGIDVTHLPGILVSLDRVIGWRNMFDDAPNDVVGYGMPGVAANQAGDLAVVYSRTSSKMFPQVRYSTWLHGEFDIRPSQLLRKGDGPIPVNLNACLPLGKCSGLRTDTAGVAVDPFDHTAIWMAHLFANSSGAWRVAVGKVFGKQHPDINLSGVTFSPATLKAGGQLKVSYTIANTGDGTAKTPRVKIVLVPDAGGAKITLGEDAPANLASGASMPRTFNAKLPVNLAAGNYRVRVEGRVTAGEPEYNDDNDDARAVNLLKVAP